MNFEYDEREIQRLERFLCNAIMVVWQAGEFEAAYSNIGFRELNCIQQSGYRRVSYRITAFRVDAENPILQEQFPRAVLIALPESMWRDILDRMLKARKELIDTLRENEPAMRAQLEAVKQATQGDQNNADA